MSDALRPVFGLAPVACFLAALVALDSYKLVRFRHIAALLVAGMSVAGLAYYANGAMLEALPLGFASFTRYVSPVTEELLKGLVLVLLIRTHRIGFGLHSAAVLKQGQQGAELR